eukprot:5662-Heterococcus_DN1.PRE.3
MCGSSVAVMQCRCIGVCSNNEHSCTTSHNTHQSVANTDDIRNGTRQGASYCRVTQHTAHIISACSVNFVLTCCYYRLPLLNVSMLQVVVTHEHVANVPTAVQCRSFHVQQFKQRVASVQSNQHLSAIPTQQSRSSKEPALIRSVGDGNVMAAHNTLAHSLHLEVIITLAAVFSSAYHMCHRGAFLNARACVKSL